MDDFTKEVVLTAIRDMFKGNSFSLCTIDRCLKLTGSIPDSKTYDSLSALHCISWKEMSVPLRKAVFEKTIEMLTCEGFNLSALDMIFNDEKGTFELGSSKGKLFRLIK